MAGFEIEPLGTKPPEHTRGFQIEELPRPTPRPTNDPEGLGWMSNEEYYASGVPSIIPTGPEAGRMAVETGASYVGGSVGGAVGALTRSPAGAAASMRIGEAAGAGIGSLISESFDPTEHPFRTAATAATFTGATGLFASGTVAGLRRALGKPTEAGNALIQNLAAHGEVPPAGTVLDGPFAADAQSFGGGAFFVGRRIKEALETAQDLTSENARNYVSSFQRYHDGAKLGFAKADRLLRVSGLGNVRMVPVDADVIAALKPAIEVWRREGLIDKFPADLQWLANLPPTVTKVRLTTNEASALDTLLYNRAREIDATPRDISTAADATKMSAAMRDKAGEVQASIGKAIDDAINNKQLPPAYRTQMVQAKQLWKWWKQGEILEDILVTASKDLSSATPRANGESIIRQLDRIIRRERDIGRELLDPQMKKSMRFYADALKVAKSSEEEGAFKLAVRQGQVVGYSRTISQLAAGVTGGAGVGYAVGGAGGATRGALAGAGFILTAPPLLAWMFTNPKANAFLIRGLKAKPGTAAAARIGREMMSLMAANGWMPPERVQEMSLQDTRDPSTIPTPTEPPQTGGGLRGEAPTGGGADPFTMRVYGRG